MSTPQEDPFKRNKPKSVRFPEGQEISSARESPEAQSVHSNDDGSAAGSPPPPPAQGRPGLVQRADSRYGRPGSSAADRDLASSDESGSDSDSDSDDDEQTRFNTLVNRNTLHDDSPNLNPPDLHVTPPPLSDSNAQMYGGLLDVGAKVSAGLAPGAAEVEEENPFELEEEYRQRRNQLLNSLEKNHMAHSMPTSLSGSPRLNPVYESSDNIPELSRENVAGLSRAHELNDDELEARLRQLEADADAASNHKQSLADSESAIVLYDEKNATQSPLESPKETDEGHHRRTSLESKRSAQSADSRTSAERAAQLTEDARAEARDLAAQLVKKHASKHRDLQGSSGDLYVPNNNYLMNAGLMDLDVGDDADDDDRRDEEAPEPQIEAGDDNYVAPPKRVKEGVLGALLRLYADEDDAKSQTTLVSSATSPMTSTFNSPAASPLNSPDLSPDGSRTPTSPLSITDDPHRPDYFRSHSTDEVHPGKKRPKWYKHRSAHSVMSLGKLAASSMSTLAPASAEMMHSLHYREKRDKADKPGKEKSRQKSFDSAAAKAKAQAKAEAKAEARRKKKERMAERYRITIHIADVLQRQRFILRIGRALMLFGAPSHRLEEYLVMIARVLEIDAQFLYMPGCMLVSFGDVTTHTSETKLLRVTQGLNLVKLDRTHAIYKKVIHDEMALEQASESIDELLASKPLYNKYLSVLFFALASANFCVFSFGGWWWDIPITFWIGGMVGFLQVWVAPRSDLYNNVFEVTSSILVSFIGRAMGSIWRHGERLFCFSAIVQGSLALILPGYIILCGSLELQSKNLVAGSVRMFYAIIYSEFLSFGITLGSLIYGWIDHGATSDTVCQRKLDDKWKILFAPLAPLFLGMVNQASPRQLPTMILIACAGYCVIYWVQRAVPSASSFTSAIGAFVVGILGNLYSRIGHGLAFAAMLPGIFVLVPSGVASQGSLVQGIVLANEIVSNTTKNGGNGGQSSSGDSRGTMTSTTLGTTMTQVAVGITVGLFVATLVVYPLGSRRKRSGLFTF